VETRQNPQAMRRGLSGASQAACTLLDGLSRFGPRALYAVARRQATEAPTPLVSRCLEESARATLVRLRALLPQDLGGGEECYRRVRSALSARALLQDAN